MANDCAAFAAVAPTRVHPRAGASSWLCGSAPMRAVREPVVHTGRVPVRRARRTTAMADSPKTESVTVGISSKSDSLRTERADDAASALPDALPLEESAGLMARREKYLYPMRADNTEVFFDHSVAPGKTLMVVFANDTHGMALDVISVLKALGVKCWRMATSKNDALQLVLSRIEGELVSVRDLKLSLDNTYAFWITDEESGFKFDDDPERLEQIRTCIKLELAAPGPRPKPANPDMWHRVSVELNRANRYSVFTLQSSDRPKLLAEVSSAFASSGVDVTSAAIQTYKDRVENSFFVTSLEGAPLTAEMAERVVESIMRAVLKVGDTTGSETLWYQIRRGSAMLVAEAIFIDVVCNKTLKSFAKFETPNFRGRLPDAPYRPISME